MRDNRFYTKVIPSHSRRRGQALLLSVLIMIFIVLLGTTFISIVASNMSNTARTGAKDAARQAAMAGIQFADNQLSGSAAGLDWRPDLSPTADTYYYTAFDRAQGWSQEFFKTFMATPVNPTPTPARFVKYPNPEGASTSAAHNASNFMLRVSQVEDNEPDNTGNTKTGDIRIEAIGFAEDDPAAYYRIVAYKKGPANNPLTAAMRSISNWDWDDEVVPQAVVDNSGASSETTFAVINRKGSFANGDSVTIWDPVQNLVGNGVVANVSAAVITVSASIGFTPSAGSVIQKAAMLGISDALAVNYDNQNPVSVDFRVSALKDLAGNDVNTPGSVWVNGGLVWSGKDFVTNLISAAAAGPGNPASNIQVTGVFTKTAAADVQATGSGVTAPTAIPTSSVDTNYATNPTVTNGLIDDGLNRMRGSLDPTRQVQEFTPPDITAGGEGFGRYRQLTQYSQSTNATYPQASAYGYGQGIYINNPTDVERAGSNLMTDEELKKLWFTDDTVDNKGFQRLNEPEDPTANNMSLEQQHMRGWVAPDQFVPRGAEVVINGDNTLTINLDPLADNSTAYPAANFASSDPTPDPSKGWRNPDGNLAGDPTVGGVYSRIVPWPPNGTIFAEGNIRIRGVDTAAPASLTVVSMNNIYIEGSLKLSNPDPNILPKVLLLAKKNVVVNPTAVLEPIQSVTRLSAATVGGANTITVYDPTNFRNGDYITIAGSANVYRVNNVDTGTGVITIEGTLAATSRPANSVVQTVFDPRTDISAYTSPGNYNRPYTTAIRLSRDSNVIQRRVHWPDDSTGIRLAFRHSAEYRKALSIAIQHPTTDPREPDIEKAWLTNKIKADATDPQEVIEAVDKTFNVTYNQTPPGTPDPGVDTFPATVPADQATAAGTSLDDLVTEVTGAHDVTQWNYDPTRTIVDPNYTAKGADIPYYFLASAGSRYPSAIPNPTAERPAKYTPQPTVGTSNPYPPASEPSRPVFPDPTSGVVDMPMATSVWVFLNNAQAALSIIPGVNPVNQFGFSPIFVDADTPENELEDVLTTDQYFYQPHVPIAPDTTYPYYFPGVANLEGDYTSTYEGQNKYDLDSLYTLDSRTITVTPEVGDNEIALQLNNAVVDGTNTVQSYFTNKTSPTDTEHSPIPYYRLSNLKLQNEGFEAGTLNALGTGTTLEINAYVYAQEGGWNVIPGAYFDSEVQNNQDLNRDGIISPGETIAAYRYHRYNYQIVFHGAIMENQTANMAHVKDWTDKWATVKMDVAAAPAYDSTDPQTSNLNTILYYYDPTAATGVLNTDVGFHAPVAAGGLIYQG